MHPPIDPLSSTPISILHADSSLSSTLISTLLLLIPRSSSRTISVGHGHGLLEAYLLQSDPHLDLIGIDVVYQSPQYIPHDRTCILPGTFATSIEAATAEAWLFVYPKDLDLLGKYTRKYAAGVVKIIVWIGPRMDLEEIERGISRVWWKREVPKDNGLKDYEALVVWRKNIIDG